MDRTTINLASLHPYLQPYAREVIHHARAVGLPAVVVEGKRSAERQRELYAQGRTAPGRRVTNTLASYHLVGRAFDVAFLVGGRITYDVPESWWSYLGAVGKRVGWRWGGDFSTPDRPHFEF